MSMRSGNFQFLRAAGPAMRWFFVAVLSSLFAQFAMARVTAPPPAQGRISRPVSDSQTSVVKGNIQPMARSQYDQGPVNPSFHLGRITMIFQRTQAQQAALDQLLAEQQNPSSPNYHKWLTPAEFANQFGIAATDLAKIAGWLTAQGFTIVETPPSRTYIAFSGTAAQVQTAFHTAIHRYTARGESFFANQSEPSVPSAFSGLVLGFRGLNDFPVKPRGVMRRVPAPSVKSSFTTSIGGTVYHFLAPDDFATIYDLKPLYNMSPAIDGTGQKIAVMGQTDIELSDIATFRSLSGLPANVPTLQLVPGSKDPGIVDGDVPEASLDVEWSGAVAKNATIIYVYADSSSGGGVFGALGYAIGNDVAPVLSISYGACENMWTTAQISSVVAAAQQANAQGMTILAPSGDGGAADCDGDSGTYPATQGLNVDVPASLPYVTGVGGTEFNEGNGAYWNTSNNISNGSATMYIPEVTWNDTSSTNDLFATGGGVSTYFSKPTWQVGITPNDNARDVPDISVAASPNHDGYLLCTQIKPKGSSSFTSSCVNGFAYTDGKPTVYGGTSFGPPTFGGIVALINQETNSAGQGNVNFVLYSLAASTPSAFHDVMGGANGFSGNEVPCTQGTTDCLNGGNIGYPAVAGYDLATGLGSFKAFDMVTAWSSVSPPSAATPTLTSISPPTKAAGSGDFTLTANGSNFAQSAQISWNGQTAGVTMQPGGTSTTLAATISGSLIAYGTQASITVTNPSPTSPTSAAQTFTVTAAPPPNDNFANAAVIANVPYSDTVDNSGATTESTDPALPSGCASQSTNTRTKTVWWSYTAGSAGSVSADTIGSSYDTTLSVWTGTPGNFSNVACNDDIISMQDVQSQLQFNATAGTTYYFMVAPFGPPDPAQDQFGGKTVLNVSVSGGGTVSALSASPTEQTVNAGSSATFQIINSSSNTFVLTCSGLPTGAACNTVSVNPNSTASLVITTTSRGLVPGPSLPPFGTGFFWQLLIGLFAVLGLAAPYARHRRVRILVPAALLVALVLFAGGCGGSSTSSSTNPNGTPAGTYNITVTGTAGTVTQKTSVVLQVN